jgi:hypothetical protein
VVIGPAPLTDAMRKISGSGCDRTRSWETSVMARRESWRSASRITSESAPRKYRPNAESRW